MYRASYEILYFLANVAGLIPAIVVLPDPWSHRFIVKFYFPLTFN